MTKTYLTGKNLENFLLYALATVARTDITHIDRRYSTAAEFADDVLTYLDLDTDRIDVGDDIRKDFAEFRKTCYPVDTKPESLLSELEEMFSQGDVEASDIVGAYTRHAQDGVDQEQLTELRRTKSIGAWMFNFALISLSIGVGFKWGWESGLILVSAVYMGIFLITVNVSGTEIRKLEGGKQS